MEELWTDPPLSSVNLEALVEEMQVLTQKAKLLLPPDGGVQNVANGTRFCKSGIVNASKLVEITKPDMGII